MALSSEGEEAGGRRAGPLERRPLWRDPSAWTLLLANLLTLLLALVERWPIVEVMQVYWLQSVIIGAFHFARMMSLRRFTTAGMTENGRPLKPTRATQLRTSFFFLVHYGFFHLVYLFFLGAAGRGEPLDLRPLAIGGALFLANHLFSFLHNLREDLRETPALGALMLAPYARIIPMHLAIVLGAWLVKGPIGTLLFLALKTGVDLAMHAIHHRRGGEKDTRNLFMDS